VAQLGQTAQLLGVLLSQVLAKNFNRKELSIFGTSSRSPGVNRVGDLFRDLPWFELIGGTDMRLDRVNEVVARECALEEEYGQELQKLRI
jgi:hypothetical protein